MIRKPLALVIAISLFAAASVAQAQWRDILNKVDANKDKLKKGAKVATAATHEFSEEEETDIGRIVAARILATYPLSSSEKLQKYVTLVGNTVAAYSPRPALDWHFSVLDSTVVNAFSTPGGYIFVTTGALTEMHSEAELAAVLGHEIAHTTQKHILAEIKRNNVTAAGLDLAQSTASSASWLNDDMARKIGQTAYEKLFTTGLSRQDELEADRLGLGFATDAGYRASAVVGFLESLGKLSREGNGSVRQFTATHPSADDRIAALRPAVSRAERGELLAERWDEWTR
jgi:predicted Zn-dependent protease